MAAKAKLFGVLEKISVPVTKIDSGLEMVMILGSGLMGPCCLCSNGHGPKDVARRGNGLGPNKSSFLSPESIWRVKSSLGPNVAPSQAPPLHDPRTSRSTQIRSPDSSDPSNGLPVHRFAPSLDVLVDFNAALSQLLSSHNLGTSGLAQEVAGHQRPSGWLVGAHICSPMHF